MTQPVSPGPIALFAAMEIELTGLRRHLTPETSSDDGPGVSRGRIAGKQVVLVETGVGPERAHAVAEAICRRCRPAAAISLGFAGALRPELRAGDLVLTGAVCRPVGAGAPNAGALERIPADPALMSAATRAAAQANLPWRQGDSLTVAEPLVDAAAKRRAADQFPVDIVEMESYAIAGAAAGHSVPFIALRVISDTAEESIEGFAELAAPKGRGRAMLRLLSNPGRARAGARLGLNVLRARKTLTAAALGLVELL